MPPLVSIIITNYNYGRFLGEAIESALAQTWQNREILFIDDGSTDATAQVAAEHGATVLGAPYSMGSRCVSSLLSKVSSGKCVTIASHRKLLAAEQGCRSRVRAGEDGIVRADLHPGGAALVGDHMHGFTPTRIQVPS